MTLSLDGKIIGAVQVGIPVPTRPGGKASPERRALEEMDTGESRAFSGFKSRLLVQTCASIRKKHPERQYTVRSMGQDSPVVRVWRTA
jgi:hypothetical protein